MIVLFQKRFYPHHEFSHAENTQQGGPSRGSEEMNSVNAASAETSQDRAQ
jgi:hypothetical protein